MKFRPSIMVLIYLLFGLVSAGAQDATRMQIISDKPIFLWAEPDGRSEHKLTIPNLADVFVKCPKGPKKCTNPNDGFLHISFKDFSGFIDIQEIYRINKQINSASKKYRAMLASKIGDMEPAYMSAKIVFILDLEDSIKFKEQYSGLSEISWSKDETLMIRTNSADAGAFSEMTYKIHAEGARSELVLGVHGASFSGGPGPECTEGKGCFCSYQIYSTKDKKYYFESGNGVTVYMLRSADFTYNLAEDKKANKFCFRPDYSLLRKIFNFPQSKTIQEVGSHPRGLKLKIDNKSHVLDYDTDTISAAP